MTDVLDEVSTSGLDLVKARLDTPASEQFIHFNNAGSGLMPRPVAEAMASHIDQEFMIGGYEAADANSAAIDDLYSSTADLLGCRPHNIAFTSSATDAYSRALSSIPFERGDVILTTQDDFVSNQLAFLSLEKRLGVRVVHAAVAPAGGVDVGHMESLMRSLHPRLVAVTHIPMQSGLVQPVAEIGRLCRELDILYLVDACQSVGQRRVDAEEIGCDFLSATYRKFLRGPRGSGFLYVSDRALEQRLEPLFIDVRGGNWISPREFVMADGATRFEDWEFAYAGVIGSAVAVRYALGMGIDAIARRATQLGTRLRDGLESIDGVRVLDRGTDRCAIVTFVAQNWDAAELRAALKRRKVNSVLSLRLYAQFDFSAKGIDSCVRLSPHYYNTVTEVDEVVAMVAELAEAKR